MIETEVLPGTGGKEESDAILNHQNNLAVCTILKLLRTIAIDGFRYVAIAKEYWEYVVNMQ